ncbi:MAG: hypothetical protein V4649_06890 [Bacteroidota bacterium]
MLAIILNILMLIKEDMLLLSAAAFVALNIIYFTSVKFMLFRFKRKYDKSPLANSMFRVYSSNLISNSPSKKEKRYYIASNKVTLVFNTLLVLCVLFFVMVCFR